MLRRKLLLVAGSVVTLLLVAGILAVVLLQSVLDDLDHVGTEALAGTTSNAAIQLRAVSIQSELERARLSKTQPDARQITTALADVREQLVALGRLEVSQQEGMPPYAHLLSLVDQWSEQIQREIKAPETLASAVAAQAEAMPSDIRQQLADLDQAARNHAERQQRSATARFRGVSLGLGLAFALVLNASIMVMARLTGMILKPVDRLVEASRRLAHEEFDCRVELNRRDEFGELAQSFNLLAAQLQFNEQRKIETLHQVARTLNHELNNAMSIIQLQLDLMARTSGATDTQVKRLREIQQALSRMGGTVAALTRVRRIVLTDYLSGVKMLDLQASVAEEPMIIGAAAESQRSTADS